jgi:ferredoxin-NADP reductase
MLICKSMGVGTFTGQLMEFLAVGDEVLIDGPHGSPPSIKRITLAYNSLLFAAGGVGITPIASMLQVLQDCSDELLLRKVDVTFVWIVKEGETLGLLPWVLSLRNCASFVRVEFYITSGSVGDGVFQARVGRPDIHEICYTACVGSENSANGEPHAKKKAFVFVCGPDPLVSDVRSSAKGIADVYTEEFHF